ncbi:MAG: hypothetical protein IT230_04790 [Flavobacteriales bacterium]|nr:hypothetical protein [Flavobacteriales bacterium]
MRHLRPCLLAGFLLLPSALPAAADLLQDDFVALLQGERTKLGEAAAPADVEPLVAELRSAQCSLTLAQGLEAKAWNGVVQEVEAGEGGWRLTLAFADRAFVTTAAPSADGSAATLVDAATPATADVALLAPEERVVFSGHFLPVEGACVLQLPPETLADAIRQPRFLFVFTEVKKL